MAKAKTVWGIDIGQLALKALKLRSVDGQLFVDAFDVIEHPKMLCQEDADPDQLVRNALAQFLARNNVSGSKVSVAMPGRSSFTRFVKLPPVEKSKIPDIVQFEAGQQIPFPIQDVVWRYQTFEDPDSPDVEVGLFAVKRVDVFESLAHFAMAGVPVDIVQMAPLALYNFMIHDEQIDAKGATILADVGADKTDLVVADGPRIWMRTIQIGGKSFTQSLEKAFKLSFAKAEKLKRTAAANKYARQVFQAMRPVFADLVQEIQRSIGYYTQKHRDTRFTRLVGLGNGFRLPGLQKFLERNLSIPVVRIDGYNRLSSSHNVNMPVFTDNVLSFAVAYGLAVQGLGEADIATNLLPREVARKRCWDKKRLWFAAAAAAVLLAAATPMYRAAADGKTFDNNTDGLKQAGLIVKHIERQRAEWSKLHHETQEVREKAKTYVGIYGHRSFWPDVHALISGAVAHATDGYHQLLDTEEGRKKLKEVYKKRSRRKLIFIESMTSQYYSDMSAVEAEEVGDDGRGQPRPIGPRGTPPPAATAMGVSMGRGFRIVMHVRTPMSEEDAVPKLINPLIEYIAKNGNAKPDVFKIVSRPEWTPLSVLAEKGGRGGTGRGVRPPLRGRVRPPGLRGGTDQREEEADERPENPSVLFPDEDISEDTRFTITLMVEITGDGTESSKPKDS